MIPYDVQLLGGIALHQCTVAEMQTGEGKTLVAILPLYLNALTGRNCQLVTVNDYLAKRDSEWVGSVLQWLGLTVGCIQHSMSPEERKKVAQKLKKLSLPAGSTERKKILGDLKMTASYYKEHKKDLDKQAEQWYDLKTKVTVEKKKKKKGEKK